MRTTRHPMALACLSLVLHGAVHAQTTPPKSDKIKDFLVDLGAGPISAAEIIGLSSTSVTNIQSLKDLNVLLMPMSNGDEKAGIGIQLTPARTSLYAMSASTYKTDNMARFLASVSLSYAQNTSTLDGVDYRQTAAAVHAGYYLKPGDDPIVAAHDAFQGCVALKGIETKKATTFLEVLKEANAQSQKNSKRDLTPEEVTKLSAEFGTSAAFVELSNKANEAVKTCVANAAKAKWNAPQISLTYGAGWIKPDSGTGEKLSLGRSLSIGLVLGAGDTSAFNFSLKRSNRELDLTTIATTPVYRNSSLAGARYTYRGTMDADTFGLAEISNAKSDDGTLSSAAFKYALGLDWRVIEGVWVEFRVGKSRTLSGAQDQTKALFNLKWSPTPSLPKLFASGG